MKMNKYVVRNELSGICEGIYLFRTDALASRKVTADVNSVPRNQRTFELKDLSILCIGEFDTESLSEVIYDTPRVVDFDNKFLVEHDGSCDVAQSVKEINSVK